MLRPGRRNAMMDGELEEALGMNGTGVLVARGFG